MFFGDKEVTSKFPEVMNILYTDILNKTLKTLHEMSNDAYMRV